MQEELRKRSLQSIQGCRDWYVSHDRPEGIKVADKLLSFLEDAIPFEF